MSVVVGVFFIYYILEVGEMWNLGVGVSLFEIIKKVINTCSVAIVI